MHVYRTSARPPEGVDPFYRYLRDRRFVGRCTVVAAAVVVGLLAIPLFDEPETIATLPDCYDLVRSSPIPLESCRLRESQRFGEVNWRRSERAVGQEWRVKECKPLDDLANDLPSRTFYSIPALGSYDDALDSKCFRPSPGFSEGWITHVSASDQCGPYRAVELTGVRKTIRYYFDRTTGRLAGTEFRGAESDGPCWGALPAGGCRLTSCSQLRAGPID